MTMRDREVLDLLRDEPELLAIADAVAATQRAPRRRPRPRGFAALALAAAALFVLVLASPWEQGSGRGLVVQRALAAIETRGPVMHAVVSFSVGWRVELATAKTTQRTVIEEIWYDREHQVARVYARRDGKVLVDQTLSTAGRDLSLAVMSPFPFDETDYYREALASGKAKVVGEGTWRGREVYWLALTAEAPDSLRVGVDRRTYRPVVLRSVDEQGRPTGDESGLLELEYTSRAKAHFGKVVRNGSEFGGGSMSSGGGVVGEPPLTPAKARVALGVPAVWAGRRLAGLPLTDLGLQHTTYQRDGGPELKGVQLQLVYGGRSELPAKGGGPGIEIAIPPEGGGPGIGIDEMRAGSPVWEAIAEGPPPGKGFADLESSRAGTGAGDEHEVWHAALSVGEVWVSIDAPSRELAITAARELRPIPPS